MERCLVPIGVALSDGYENWVCSREDFMNSAGALFVSSDLQPPVSVNQPN
uniref:Transposase n=1 Tax=Heterorhabditis bacteriophora TaxID=37862 RepID=A0A1I7WKN6_HETBA